MLKALLIGLATFVSFDAVAWQSAMRHQLLGEAKIAASEIAALDWSWD